MKPLFAVLIVLALASCSSPQSYGPVQDIDKQDIDDEISRETQGVAL